MAQPSTSTAVKGPETAESVQATIDPTATLTAHESKRKQAHPHKNVPQPTKKRGRKRKLAEEGETGVVPTRGRPRKKVSSEVDADAENKTAESSASPIADGKNVDSSVAPSKINSQLTNSPQVNVERLNVEISPVKIVQGPTS
jgi:hypothetical protein